MTKSETTFNTWASPSDCPVYVELADDNNKPLLILLHGFMMSRAIWMENLASLSKHFRCATIELLGHGRSAAPAETDPYQMSSYLNAINALRNEVQASSCLFCAHSFGAGITLSYGLAYPENTQGIVITNSRSALGAIKQNPGDLERMKYALRTKGREALQSFPWHPKHMNEIRPPVQDALIQDANLLDPIGVSNSIEITAADANLANDLHSLSPPTLLINGRKESGFQSARNKVAANYPHIQIQDFDAGHSVNAELPEAFNRSAISFLTSLPR